MRLIRFLILLLPASSLLAQDEIGIAGSSRAPANTVFINPSSIVDSRAFMDIHLIGAGAFARNNLVYIPREFARLRNMDSMSEPGYNRGAGPYHAYADAFVHGPSVTFAVRQHAFGLHTRFRTVADARGIPNSLGYYLTEGFQYREQMGEQQTVKDLRSNGLSWGEVGVSYGTIISRSGDMITQAGITAKYLVGVAGVGLRVDEWVYTVLDSSRMETERLQGEYAFNDPGLDNFSWNNGRGWGIDLGITFKQRLRQSSSYVPHDPCTDGDYRYKLGFSLLDVGAIRFSGTFYRNVFNETEQSQWNDFSGTTMDDVSDLDSLLNAGFSVAQDNSDQRAFRMMLPMGASAQFDYNLGHGFYALGIVTAGVPWKNRLGVQRASYLGVVPRWEKKRFEVALPFSLYQFRHPQLGVMFRFNSIVIGSDNIGWRLFRRDVYGADLYVSVKYTVFRHWKCAPKKMKKAKIRRRGPGEPVPCPAW